MDNGTNGTAVAIAAGSETDAVTIRELRERVASMAARIDDYASRLAESQRRHRSDIAIIGEALMSEANERDWCNEYDEIIDALNERVSYELPTRKRDYQVAVQATVYISVEAKDDEEARDKANDVARELESYVDRYEGVSTSHWDSEYDYRVEEA